MNILLLGSGGREHALAWQLAQSPGLAKLYAAPGNPGIAEEAELVALEVTDHAAVIAFCADKAIDLVVVGPEAPLVLGLVDALAEKGIPAFGPSKSAARLEGSKVFMKQFLKRHGIPTAGFEVFDDAEKAIAYARQANRGLVVKADGLAAGKGVVVASSVDETVSAIESMMVKREFGDAGSVVVLEELLPGEEASFHVVCDGTRAVPLVAAQDHKRVGDGDRGPNTGGMGAYAPAPVVTAAMQEEVMRTVVEPTLRGMAAEGNPFRGVLFVGLMVVGGKPYVLEFNVRFGDPETTVLVPMLDGDWFALLDGAAKGDMSKVKASTKPGAALAVVMAAEHYPAKPATGDRISGLDVAPPDGVFVFHAGTKREGDAVVTSGGRVITVCAAAGTFDEAHAAAYAHVARITWRGEHHRTDIGHRARGR
jgi:phosphoribosylamine--glycine ligase